MNLSEEYILYDLPLARGYAYRHAIMRSHGIQTYFYRPEEDKIKDGLSVLEKLAAINMDDSLLV